MRSSGENAQVSSLDSGSARVLAVHYVLEESSGYMEPTLRILAVLHTVISFFCIIGYYCLKVRRWGPGHLRTRARPRVYAGWSSGEGAGCEMESTCPRNQRL